MYYTHTRETSLKKMHFNGLINGNLLFHENYKKTSIDQDAIKEEYLR